MSFSLTVKAIVALGGARHPPPWLGVESVVSCNKEIVAVGYASLALIDQPLPVLDDPLPPALALNQTT